MIGGGIQVVNHADQAVVTKGGQGLWANTRPHRVRHWNAIASHSWNLSTLAFLNFAYVTLVYVLLWLY